MARVIYVVGLHRAGTHTFAEHIAKQKGLPYLEEGLIRWNHFQSAMMLAKGFRSEWVFDNNRVRELRFIREPKLDNGFVLQCPGLSPKIVELIKQGEVYWLTRDHLNTVTSMRNAGIDQMAWDIVKDFRTEFPSDPIWNKLTYDGKEDVHYGFVNYLALTVKVKEYFYKTKFKGICKRTQIEDQSYYDFAKTLTTKKPLKAPELKRAEVALEYYESLCVD